VKAQSDENGLRLDPVLLGAVLTLVGLGIVMVYSASAFHAHRETGDALFYLKRHAVAAGLGLVAMLVVARLDYHLLARLAYPLLLVVAVLLAAVLLFGNTAGGATRWFRFGGFSFQPSEVAKLALIVYLAHSLTRKREKIRSFSFGFLPHVLMSGALIMLVLVEPDLGTAAIMSLILFALLFVAGTKISYLLLAALAALPLLYHQVMGTPWRKARILAFLDPEANRLGAGYQLHESLIAFGSGGGSGVGLGDGKQKLFFLPASHTDFLFSILGEEIGFIGAMLVIVLFAVVVWRGLRAALHAPDLFGTYLALGVSLLIGLQAVANMSVALGLVPTKGLALPLLSYGGSSLVATMAGIGLLFSIGARAQPDLARRGRKPVGVPA